MNIPLLLFYLFMFKFSFIVLLLLLCHVMPVTAYMAFAFVFGFIQINWWWWSWWWYRLWHALQNAADSVWTERSDVKITWSGQSYTDAYTSLDVLGEYVDDHDDLFDSVDHVALFTGYVRKMSLRYYHTPVFEKTCEATQKNVQSHVILDFEKKR